MFEIRKYSMTEYFLAFFTGFLADFFDRVLKI